MDTPVLLGDANSRLLGERDRAPFGAPVARIARGVEPWLSTADVAERLKVSRATVYGLIKSGALGHRRIGLQIRIAPSDLDEFLRR